MFVFPRRLDQLSRFHRWVDLALLFKKGVGREITVLEVADNVFSNVQHSRNPVLKFCRRRTTGDFSQSTILRPELFPGGSVFAPWKRTLYRYNLVVLDGESYGRGRLTSRSFSATCSPVWLRKTTSPSKRIKSSSAPQESSQTWLQKLVEGDLLHSRSTTTRLRCSCFFRGYAVRWRGSSGLRRTRVSQLPICADTLFFLLNECSLSQNECL